MKNNQFEQIINRQFNNCRDLLVTKGKEYTPDKDVFEVFNKAATLSGEGGRKAALFNFMLKHLVSISDMCHSDETYSTDRWNEKITDAMNYLLLLKAMVEEDEIHRNDPTWQLTGHTTEELTTEIKLDQFFTKDGVFEASILTEDCKNPEECGATMHGFKWVPDKPSYASFGEMAKAVEWDERDTCDKNCEECVYYKDWKLGNTLLKDIEGPYCFFEISDKDIQKAEKAVAKKNCRTCDMAIWSLNADKSEDKPVCFKKARGECDGDARVPGCDSLTQDKVTSEKKDYNFKKYYCDLDLHSCILGGSERCPTCKHWVANVSAPNEKLTTRKEYDE